MRNIGSFILLYILFFPILLYSEECPGISSFLQSELTKEYPGFIIADEHAFPRAVYERIVEQAKNKCFHAVGITEYSFAILLRKRNTDQYRVILAKTLTHSRLSGWSLYLVEDFKGETPLLEPVKGGMYLDIETGSNFLITRNCKAYLVRLLHSGKQYIYKCGEEGKYEKFRIK